MKHVRYLARLRLVALAAWLLLGCAASAQEIPPDAAEALRAGQRLAAEALVTYDRHFPDQRLWAEALAAGRAAATGAPDHPAPHRFLAQAYGHVAWYSQAWSSWQQFLEVGGTLDATASRQLLEAAFWLGIQAFAEGWTEPARIYLETVLDLDPENIGAHDRLARLALDRGAPSDAQPHLDRLDETLVTDLPGLRERADLQARHGAHATDLFLAGRAAQDVGDQRTAFDRFAAATAASGAFTEAWRGRAVTAAALGRPADAVTAWERVLQLGPGDATATAGFVQARDQLAFGVDAQRAFERGTAAHRAGDISGARIQFQIAVAQNPGYVDALAWLGRIAAETGDLATATTRYREALALNSNRTDLSRALAELVERQTTASQAARAVSIEPAAVTSTESEDEPTVGPPSPAAPPTPSPAGAPVRVDAVPEAEAAPDTPTVARAVDDTDPSDPGDGAWTTLIDRTIEHRSLSDGGSGAFTFLDAPQPRIDLEDARSANLYVRLEVRAKPTAEPLDYQLCLLPEDISSAPACTSPERLRVSGPGTYTLAQRVESLTGGAVDGRFSVVGLLLVLRHPDGRPIDEPTAAPRPANEAATTSSAYPMEVHVTGALVSHGQAVTDSP